MSDPCIIYVAITGSLPTNANNPAVPISINEQIESTQEAFEAGAAIVHAHVRNEDGTPLSDPDKFARLKEGLEMHCPGMIIQFSAGGWSGAGQKRGGMLRPSPRHGLACCWFKQFSNSRLRDPPDLVDWLAARMKFHRVNPEIEAFDLSHIFQAARMHKDGRIVGKPYVQFVMGVKNAMPVDRDVLDFYIKTVRRLFGDDAPWCAAGIGAQQLTLNEWAVCAGGHARTGLEDNIRQDRNTLALSNAALVRRVVKLCDKHRRPVAGWTEARRILVLKGRTAPSLPH